MEKTLEERVKYWERLLKCPITDIGKLIVVATSNNVDEGDRKCDT